MKDVPPSTVTNVNASTLLAVLVILGVAALGQRIDVGQVNERAVPLAFKSSVKLAAVPLAGTLLMVILVTAALSATGPKTLPLARSSVRLPPEIVGTLADSV